MPAPSWGLHPHELLPCEGLTLGVRCPAHEFGGPNIQTVAAFLTVKNGVPPPRGPHTPGLAGRPVGAPHRRQVSADSHWTVTSGRVPVGWEATCVPRRPRQAALCPWAACVLLALRSPKSPRALLACLFPPGIRGSMNFWFV